MLHSMTVSIPVRWQKGALQIQGFIQHYTQGLGQNIVVNIAAESTQNRIWMADAGDLTQSEYEAADYAIQMLNEGLSRVGSDLWNQKPPANQSLTDRLAELAAAFRKKG
jgi:hypothetical protein